MPQQKHVRPFDEPIKPASRGRLSLRLIGRIAGLRGCNMRLHIIGVSEKLTSIEINTATLAVMPNSNSNRPVTLERNETGRKTITSESVVASTASPISRVPSMAAALGECPFSSITRNTFSSTMIASSITTPTINTSASIVTLFIVKSIAFMTANAPTIEVGIATAAIIVERHDRMNSRTIKLAMTLPEIR